MTALSYHIITMIFIVKKKKKKLLLAPRLNGYVPGNWNDALKEHSYIVNFTAQTATVMYYKGSISKMSPIHKCQKLPQFSIIFLCEILGSHFR